ncbi:MAG: thiamine pyrophosphate-dependent dehydrogenase E1 component subunit alpha [Minwuia sp.]|nr:thiamine pyrophosphate-dependent dehydrogenase E1 component subunit alpha [Minwuia sp.]
MDDLRNLDRDRFLDLHRQMLRIRALEETALRGLKDGLVLGAIHPSIGQEAIAAGVAGQLRRDDILLSTHRGHGHTLAKGADPEAMMRELFGRQGGNCGGKGGSMHIADFSVGMLGANGVVGANIIIATGAAHAISLHGDDRVVACFFGDGATNRGPFLEGLNWAAVFNLPVLFICEDNGFAATTRTEDLTAGPGPAARAEAFGIAAETIDGNDITAVVEAADRLVTQVRRDRRPAFLLAKTYRLTGHTGADPASYRAAEEVERAWSNDPIARSAALLTAAGVTTQTLTDMSADIAQEMEGVFQAARAAPRPEVGDALTDVLDARQSGMEVA